MSYSMIHIKRKPILHSVWLCYIWDIAVCACYFLYVIFVSRFDWYCLNIHLWFFFSGTSFQRAFAAAAMRGSLMSEICTKNVTWQPTLAILRLGYQHMHLFTLQAKWSMSCAAMLQRRSELTSLGRMKLFLICHMCIKDNTL